ncbi:TetR/AcrR family transcriptional regulator [Cryobacterium sp. PH31-AA6]|uniref:TetR/AcrR family transcriptional regulator n=1 Tax=Cryobacterium sp. PH31-AA6 TaxID=3046205 RepID=UPI0024B8BBE0|nr:TetR/AcrR family transcriptional regulator [Cryobacterium sp. PH31-AA6]MDJ0322748.1 TetR/AcrR family transcriptional regulator [Cryobacterium sp. PH31-AA6]
MDFPPETQATRRTRQSAATRAVIVEAASRLMLERGYVPTSIAAIAESAGVAVQTIYNSIGGKADVLSAVLDRSAAGPDAPTLVPTFMRKRVAAAGTSAEVVGILADWFVEVNARTAGVHRVITQAAGVDPEVAKLELRRAAQRLHNYGEAASTLRTLRGLRSGLSDHEAAAAIWAIGHPQVYRSLVIDLGWSVPAYREWVLKTLSGALT